MSIDLSTVIAGLVGGLIGAFTTLLGTSLQHWLELRRDQLREARARTVQAAENCLMIFSKLEDAIDQIEYGNHDRPEVIHTLESRIESLNSELFENLPFLPSELRERVNSARVIMVFARLLADGRYHYLNRAPIASNASHHAQECLAAFVRHEPIPMPTDRFRELQAAVADMNKTQEELPPADHVMDYQRRLAEFKQSHPELFVQADSEKISWWKIVFSRR